MARREGVLEPVQRVGFQREHVERLCGPRAFVRRRIRGERRRGGERGQVVLDVESDGVQRRAGADARAHVLRPATLHPRQEEVRIVRARSRGVLGIRPLERKVGGGDRVERCDASVRLLQVSFRLGRDLGDAQDPVAL